MSTPYEGGGYSPNPAAVSKVATVGLAMQIVAGVTVLAELLGALSVVLQMVGVNLGPFSQSMNGRGNEAMERVLALTRSGIGLVLYLPMIAVNAFVIYAGQKVKALESYTVAMIGAVLLIVPASCFCFCCCSPNFIRIPVGVWALITLLDSEVKSSFRS